MSRWTSAFWQRVLVADVTPTPLTLVGVLTETKIMSHSAMYFSGSAEKKRLRPRAAKTICSQTIDVTESGLCSFSIRTNTTRVKLI